MKRKLLNSLVVTTLVLGLAGCGGFSEKLTLSEVRKNINSYSEEEQLKAVKYNKKNIIGITNPSLKVQEAALRKKTDCKTFERIQNPHRKIVLEVLPFCSYAIKYIKNPTEEQQLIAVGAQSRKDSVNVLSLIKNPSLKVQNEAIKYNFRSIEHIDNPTEEQQLMAVKSQNINDYDTVLSYIKNPTKKVQLEALKRNYRNIRDIEKPTEEMKRLIEENQLAAIKENSSNYYILKNPSAKIRKEQIKLYPWSSAQRIPDLTKEEQLFILEKNPTAILFLKNASEEVQIASIKYQNKINPSDLDFFCSSYLKNSTKLVKRKCYEIKKRNNKRFNFLKDTITSGSDYFQIEDNTLSTQIYATSSMTYITNKTNKFMKLSSFSIYYGEDIYTKQINYNLPPTSKSKFNTVSTQTIIDNFYLPLKDHVNGLKVGVAIEYEIEGKKNTFYKTKIVKYKE
jgi:hypothetical protein